jgi:enamine deaminase RidA (YjgF/YER057c/UK114 family)
MTSAASETITSQTAGARPPLAGHLPVSRQHCPGLEWARIGTSENHTVDLTVLPLPGETLRGMLLRLAEALKLLQVTPVLHFIFGAVESLRGGESDLKAVFGEVTWPVTWSEGTGIQGGLSGMQVICVSARELIRLEVDGRVQGVVFDHGSARHCLIGGLGYAVPGESRPRQTRQALTQLDSLLTRSGFQFSDIVRTWFYLQNILAWYNDFNEVRTAFYKPIRFRVGSLPASTGISAQNPFGSALSLAAWAIRPLQSDATPVREVISPLQCPAACYGSSFSRAVEMDVPGGKRLTVSGTASIEPGGKTVWNDDIRNQIDLTMKVVNAILESRHMSLSDVSRSTLYFKRPEFFQAFKDWFQRHGPESMPAVSMHCDICRDDLLWEIEMDCVKAMN